MTPLTKYPYNPTLLTDKKWFWNRTKPTVDPVFTSDDHQALLAIAQSNPNVFKYIATAIPTLDGWCSVEKAGVLSGLVLAMKPKQCVEIGTYAGRSFLPMLWALNETKSGRAMGIDPYDAQISAEQEFPGNQEWWAALDHGLIEKKFYGFLKAFKVDHLADVIKKKSDDVEPPASIDLLHIDGGHTDVAIRDAQRFGAKVRLGGIVVLDDIAWVGGSVLRAIDELEQMGFVECYRRVDENWNVMQRHTV